MTNLTFHVYDSANNVVKHNLNVKELEDSIYEKYPMLKLYVDEKGWNEIEDNEIKAIARYIELVETQKVSV